MSVPEIVTGYTALVAVTLKKNGSVFTIGSTAKVSATLVSIDHKTQYLTGAISQASTTDGADWSNSLVMIVIPTEVVSKVTYQGDALLEIQVFEDGVKTPWFCPVHITTGHIN